MNSSEFVSSLAESAPSPHDLLSAGLSLSEAQEFRRSFIAYEHPLHPRQKSDDPLIELVTKYDLSNVAIGMVSFSALNADRHGSTVGRVEADHLLISCANNEVLVCDIAHSGHILWRCAKDSSAFLSALAVAAQHLGRCAWDVTYAENPANTRAVATRCKELAGGSDYASFWMMLLRAES
jgi:hypothetical protein